MLGFLTNLLLDKRNFMPKVILHNLTHPYNSFNPKVFNFDQQGIFFAEPGDIVVTREKISQDYLKFLEGIGFDFKNVSFLWSNKELNNFDSIFRDKDLLGRLKRKIANPSDYFLDAYVPGSLEKSFAGALGINFYHNPDHFHIWGAKSFFRKTAKEIGLPVASGSEDIKNRSDFLLAGLKILKNGFADLIVKQDESLAGVGSKILTPKEFFKAWRNFEDFKAELVEQGIKIGAESGFILEKWFSDPRLSATIYFQIDKTKKLKLLFAGEQIPASNQRKIIGLKSGDFLPLETRNKMAEQAELFGRWLLESGFSGDFNLDVLVFADGSLIWTDFNPRKGLSIYPYKIWQKAAEGNLDFYYKTVNIRSDKLKGLNIGQFLDMFSKLLFTKQNQFGIIPYSYSWLEQIGSLKVLYLAKKMEKIIEIEQKILGLTQV